MLFDETKKYVWEKNEVEQAEISNETEKSDKVSYNTNNLFNGKFSKQLRI